MGTTVGKRSARVAQKPSLEAVEAQFEPQYIVEGSTVVLFRSSTWGRK